MCGPVMRGADALPWSKTTSRRRIASEPGRPRLARSAGRAAAGRRGAEAAAEQARSWTSLVVPVKRPNKAARSGGGGRGGKGLGRRDDRRQAMPRTQHRTRHAVPAACPRTSAAADCSPRPAGHARPPARALRASRRRGVRSGDSGCTGCGIDSRNRHVAEAELAPAQRKPHIRSRHARGRMLRRGLRSRHGQKAHSRTYETHQRPSAVTGGGAANEGQPQFAASRMGVRTAPYYR